MELNGQIYVKENLLEQLKTVCMYLLKASCVQGRKNSIKKNRFYQIAFYQKEYVCPSHLADISPTRYVAGSAARRFSLSSSQHLFSR